MPTPEPPPADPTHVVVPATRGDAAAEARATAAAVDAVLDRADAVDLHVDLRAIAGDHPAVANALETAFEAADEDPARAPDGPEERSDSSAFRAPVAAVRDPLDDLLALSSYHRFVSLERLDASRDGRRVLTHVPDHGRFRIDANAAADRDALLDDVRAALASEPAGLLPARTLATWQSSGARYALAPPSLCANDGTCFGLSKLEGVVLAPVDRVVELEWRVGDGLATRILDAIGASRPERFALESREAYEPVAGGFRTVANALDVPVETRP